MKRTGLLVLAGMGIAATAMAGIGYRALETPDEDGDVQVSLEQCPAAVQATIRRYLGDGTIHEIERSPEGRFEVDATGSEFVVAADGTYLGAEEEDDGQDGNEP
ncbi:MAG: hypothetical protein ACKVW3_17115 [Phycisphaerales bacterium]